MKYEGFLVLALCVTAAAACIIFAEEVNAEDTYTEGGFEYRVVSAGSVYAHKYSGIEHSVVIPDVTERGDTVDGIDSYCLYQFGDESTRIRSLTLGKNISDISPGSMMSMRYLESIQVAPGNTTFTTWNGALVDNENTFYKFPAQMPNTELDVSGFKVIRDCAFEYCVNLQFIELSPAMAGVLPQSAFAGCENLRSVYVTDEYSFDLPPVSVIDNSAFSGCTSLEKVVLPEQLKVICEGVFENCTSLKEIELPSMVEHIGQFAFRGCTSLEDISSESLSYVTEDGVLYYVGSYSSGTRELVLYPAAHAGDKYTIDPSVTDIQGCAFFDVKYLKEVEVMGNFTTLPSNSFYCCKSLEKVKLAERITTIGEGAFMNCENLREVVMADSPIWIWDMAFWGTYKLTKFEFGEKLENIGERAFSVSGLEDVEIPASVKNIGGCAFEGSAMKTLTINGTPGIGERAFEVGHQLKVRCSESLNITQEMFGSSTDYEVKYFDKWTFPMYNAVGIGACVLLLVGIIVLFRRI